MKNIFILGVIFLLFVTLATASQISYVQAHSFTFHFFSRPQLAVELHRSPTFTIDVSCRNECSTGEKRCDPQGRSTCGNYDNDPCLEWGSSTPCKSSEYCDQGRCLFSEYLCEVPGPFGCSGGNTVVTCVRSSSGDLSYKYTPCASGLSCLADGMTCQ